MSQNETRSAMSEAEIDAPSRCRTLVRLDCGPEEPYRTGAAVRPSSAFIAHLIATAAQAPQTRAQRRAGPEEVMDRYRRALTTAPSGVALLRSP